MTWISAPETFESKMLPHLNAAYTLARWITGNVQDAEDAVQEAYLRALRFFRDFRGGDGRAWLLQIVRNTCYTRLRKRQSLEALTTFDDEEHSHESSIETPEALAIATADVKLVRTAIQNLPIGFREILILREIEGMSYSEIAKILDLPVGSVASMLFRARERLKKRLIASTRRHHPQEVGSTATVS